MIFLIVIAGCSDFSAGSSDYSEQPIEITSVSKGEVVQPGEMLDIEYSINETEQILNRLIVTITGPGGEIYSETVIEEEPLSGWAEPLNFGEDAPEGIYMLQFDFYSGEELFISDTYSIFVAASRSSIISITSYPPVLYPGGGGLFHAETDCSDSSSWMRWTLDGEVIASGLISEGYESIEIQAPQTEGVYDLSLEIFPFAPAEGSDYDFKSAVRKDVPVYVNTRQKSGTSEFGPDEDFYALFHFRGNLLDSVSYDGNGAPYRLNYTGKPVLSLKNGIFGYYIDSFSGLSAERLLLPVADGKLQPFSLMAALVPTALSIPEGSRAGLFRSGYSDGSLSAALDVLPDGRLYAVLRIAGNSYGLISDVPMLYANEYSSIALSVQPTEKDLTIILFKNGRPESEITYPASDDETPAWFAIAQQEAEASTQILADTDAGFEAMIDEIGIYNKQSPDGLSIDPEQYRRAMELEYGKFLMYAEGFDSDSQEFRELNPDVEITGSNLIIPAGGAALFPAVYPGYEEVVFRIELAAAGTGEAVFYAEMDGTEIGSIDFKSDGTDPVSFSLVFTPEAVNVEGAGEQNGFSGFSGDFSGLVFRLVNSDPDNVLAVGNILVTRQNISISENSNETNGKISVPVLNIKESSLRS